MLSLAQVMRQNPARLRTSRRRARSGQYPPRGHGLHAWFRRSGSESSKNSSVEAQSSGVVHSAWFLVQVECVSKRIEGEACARKMCLTAGLNYKKKKSRRITHRASRMPSAAC